MIENDAGWTPAERTFSLWMLISAWIYGLSGLYFLTRGAHIVPLLNKISDWLLAFPLYPLPADQNEGAFWRVLAVSMMSMLTWICVLAHRDCRRNGNLVSILLLSKFCSTVCYGLFFLSRKELAYLVGSLTDGSLFLATAALWIPAAPGRRFISAKEERILSAVGEALVPRFGAFELGFADLREACMRDARRIFAAQSATSLLALRAMIKTVNISALLLMFPPHTLLGLAPEKRTVAVHRIMSHRASILRMIFMAVKINALLPFFSQPEVERAVGVVAEGQR